MPELPYGSWPSEISAEMVAAKSSRFSEIKTSEKGIYWVEGRPQEKGRFTIVKYDFHTSEALEVLPKEFNARSAVHEYGGGAYALCGDKIIFTNYSDNGVYLLDEKGVVSLLLIIDKVRFADFVFDGKRNIVFCVSEDHRGKEVVNSIVKIDLQDGKVTPFTGGCDFYSSLVLSPDFSSLGFISWDHPNMPWNGTDLSLVFLEGDGTIKTIKKIAGSKKEAIFGPSFSPDGVLYFISDRDGYSNIFALQEENIRQVTTLKSDFSQPSWVFGLSTYAFIKKENRYFIVATALQDGRGSLYEIDPLTSEIKTIAAPYCEFSFLASFDNTVYCFASSEVSPKALIAFDVETMESRFIKSSGDITVDPEYLSKPYFLEFPSGNSKAYAFFYVPKNPKYHSREGELPPLIVECHGGPTSTAGASLDLEVQYWTSRGFAFVDLNYRGSFGFGRKYMEELNWGITDVEDAVAIARYLAEKGFVDKERLIIRGGSAGGYTALAALTFADCYKAGASYFGVSDLEALVRDTHKFESHYLESLIGPYPEKKQFYYERSPINFVDRLKKPLIIFQGMKDKIVPPVQSSSIYESLKKRGVMTDYLTFDEEGHGFRSGAVIAKCLQAEYDFYRKAFKIEQNGEAVP